MGRTELQRNLSGAKNAEEVAGDARFCVVPRKTNENYEKPNFSNSFSIFFRNFPKLSKVETYANASEHFRTHPNGSEQVWASPKTSKNLRKPRKYCKTFVKISRNIFADARFQIFWEWKSSVEPPTACWVKLYLRVMVPQSKFRTCHSLRADHFVDARPAMNKSRKFWENVVDWSNRSRSG